ncbi:Aldo/keto reductase [Gloeophyllum trabeum ATCC 11539]|uniref:Aldo/keto reductase n=1 Tax=Gloeophyllum trabeum (strain ATCC 11539 / FP-39264 / Madison 617) TaxID=670483 RepID=S7RIK2_GLOTA|nr:Aldo/keto reductase [Gloeophyllum trabeum ATCC 11539]EPQ52424.1 Aldo/keto reductase [Gloeophyllum trabeum ATCC 11539]
MYRLSIQSKLPSQRLRQLSTTAARRNGATQAKQPKVLFTPAPPPPTALGRYRYLSPLASVTVSPLCLGAMSIGDKWAEYGYGAMNKETSFKLLDAYFDNGGNFIDTANNYQDETSEMFIGEWAEQRGIRDQLVIATKYSTMYKRGNDAIAQKVLYGGNHVKSMYTSVHESLKKLRTSYLDILYVHFWDYNTSVEEVMNGLHNLVQQGKVLYLGISDAPAWVVAKANQYARDHGKTPFVVYQGAWNVMQRDLEREIIPMCRSEGLAITPWNVLAGGHIRTDAEEEARRQSGEKGRQTWRGDWERNEREKLVCQALEDVANATGAKSIQAVAIAYVMQKTPYVFPLIGGRKVEHLLANIAALDVALAPEHIAKIESVVPFDLGFPGNIIGNGTANMLAMMTVGTFDRQPLPPPIRPAPKPKAQ